MPDMPPEEFGPCMLALDERQRKFVLHWLANRGKDAADAARRAGYSDKSEAAKVSAHRLLRSAKVSAALREEADKHLGILPVLAVIGLEKDLASKKQSVREKAQDSVLDRTGFGRKTTQDIRVEHVDNRSTADLLAAVRQLVGPGVPMIEGQFEEVDGAASQEG